WGQFHRRQETGGGWMRNFRWFLLGVFSLLAIEALAAAMVLMGARGWSAREEPTSIERAMARTARHAAIPSGVRARANPIPNTPEVLAQARAHWADHCAVCHANDGSGDSLMGKRMYPPAPDMRAAATTNFSDGELYSIIENGIR